MMNTKLNLRRRIKSPTPKFFRKIRKAGLIAGAVGTALLTAPVSLPAVLTTVAGYLVTAGIVASAVSTTAVERE
ncbi:hypothetical protein [Desertivirga arenae]|uniref:hypothetical protein n=1 Tax=Desertivirga arenae TaxID=2810309 RepID=UPI001F622A35|nr:hypothetical protein [Pedobacter sp. SYSU D00823]